MMLFNHILFYASIVFLAVAALLALWSLCKTRYFLVRLLILELLVNVFIAAIAIWSLKMQFLHLIDICIALTLMMFLSTVAYCQFFAERQHD